MCAQLDPKLDSVTLSLKAVLSLFNRIDTVCSGSIKNREQLLSDFARAVIEHLPLDRCLILLSPVSERLFEKNEELCLNVAAESCIPPSRPLAVRKYEFAKESELVKACLRRKPFVVGELSGRTTYPCNVIASESFLPDCARETIAAFPISRGGTIGCLTLHFLNQVPSDMHCQIGEHLVEELENALENVNSVVRKLDFAEPGQAAAINDGIVQTLSKQLSFERWARQTILRMHGTLDKDALLQQVADALGRGLNASRCLIVRTDGAPPGAVTHEYAEADMSPLGLGRTDQLPVWLIDHFKNNTGAFFDLADLSDLPGVSPADLKSLADNAVSAVAGAPMSRHGTNFGVIILLQCGLPKPWTNIELEVLALMAEQTAVALGHCESFLQLQGQLFNMSLLGNLTQQLTNTIEIVAKSLRADANDEKAKQALETVPLSYRELEVLRLIASGYANREIAKRLFLTESTVELHASRIRKKLKLKSRTALVKYACDNALV